MRAAIFKARGEPLEIVDIPDPEPGAGEVVLRVERCGICGSDVHMTAADGYGFPPGSILGHEFCGEVVALGRDVQGIRLGDRLTAMPYIGCGKCESCRIGDIGWCASQRAAGFGSAPGAYAEYVAVSAASSVLLPGEVSAAEGALVEPLAVALHGVKRAKLAPRMKVAVLGAGPIGLGVAFWARRLGCEHIAVIARSTRNKALAELMGASTFVTGSDPAAIAEALGGAPDAVFECVGKPGMLDQAIKIVTARGCVTVLGFCTAPDVINAATSLMKEVNIGYSKTYDLADYIATVTALAERGPPARMVSRTLPLDDLPAAFAAIRAGASDCKIQIDPNVRGSRIVS